MRYAPSLPGRNVGLLLRVEGPDGKVLFRVRGEAARGGGNLGLLLRTEGHQREVLSGMREKERGLS